MTEKRYRIIFEDDYLMVVDKPSGLLVIPTPKREANTLTGLLNAYLDKRGVEANAYPCHRLDRETSGLILYAKGKRAQRLMMDEFKKRTVKKFYLAFVHGKVKKTFDIIKSSIYNRNKNRSEHAVTRYRVLKETDFLSVLEVEPVTGRTNQIRIHLKRAGHPIVGESVYAFRKDFGLKFKRLALHASYINFTHPVTKERMEYTSGLPEDMASFMKSQIGGIR